MDYMVDAILGKTSMGECVQAFELAAGVHVGQEVHAMVNNVHVFADMPHLLHHSTEWLDMVEEKNDLTQHFVLHVSVFPRMYNTSSDNNRNDVSTSSSSDTISNNSANLIGHYGGLLSCVWSSTSETELCQLSQDSADQCWFHPFV
mmetsp:Transcript_15857/g.23867  ORF Transcript_15857/g.23867 Transcript_15857/m.23867 type:complete len:146 (-) Transcript_15857:117-554(-)